MPGGLLAAGGALLGGLITVALLLPRNRAVAANGQLAALMALAAVYQLSTLARHGEAFPGRDTLEYLGTAIFLLGPGLYLYTRARVSGDARWRRSHGWHALPFALVAADSLLTRAGLLPDGLGTTHPRALGLFFYLQILAYLGCALRRVHRARTRHTLNAGTLRWLASLLGTCLALCLPGLVFALGRLAGDWISWPQQLWSVTVVLAITYLIAFFALLDPVVFQGARRGSPGAARYRTSSLTQAQAGALWERLEAHMREHRPHLEPQLKVGDLATQLDVPPSHLSQTINQVGNCTFANYLGRYRVATARELLAASSPGERTMLDVALSAGFNSESVFYKHFRDQVGQTPRQYQQQRS